MNEKKPKWVCPVCNKPAYYEHLFLDGFYIQLLLSPKFKSIATNDIILNNDASWEPVEETTLGVSDSEDDDDISVIPITPMVDKDGAPILSDTAIPSNVPVNTFLGSQTYVGNTMTPSVATPAAVPEDDDDILVDKAYPPELDYMDWNYSVKFFHFSREPP